MADNEKEPVKKKQKITLIDHFPKDYQKELPFLIKGKMIRLQPDEKKLEELKDANCRLDYGILSYPYKKVGNPSKDRWSKGGFLFYLKEGTQFKQQQYQGSSWFHPFERCYRDYPRLLIAKEPTG